MTDKEVGEIWRDLMSVQKGYMSLREERLKDLIRKLVEERADWRLKHSDVSREPIINIEEAIAATLDDFGIEPETWI